MNFLSSQSSQTFRFLHQPAGKSRTFSGSRTGRNAAALPKRSRIRAAAVYRKIQTEHRPLSRLALHRDQPPVGFHHPVHQKQPQSRPLSSPAGCEKWIKDLFSDILCHTAPGIREGQLIKVLFLLPLKKTCFWQTLFPSVLSPLPSGGLPLPPWRERHWCTG